MITSQANLAFFFSGLNTGFRAVYDSTPIEHEKFSTVVPSDQEQQVYAMTTRIDKMRVWNGPRVVDEPNPFTKTLVNLPFEKTIGIDRFRLDDANGIKGAQSIYWPMMTDLALQTRRWPDLQMRDWIRGIGEYTSAASQLGLDGVAHWSASHPTDMFYSSKPTYCNTFGTAGVTINGQLIGGTISPNAVWSIVQYMRSIPSEDGEPLGVRATHLLHPAGLLQDVTLILKAGFYSPPTWGGQTGQVGQLDNATLAREYGIQSICWDLLDADPATFYVLDCGKAFKPFVWQLRQAPITVTKIAETDDNVFSSHKLLWGAWARGAPMGNYPFLSFRSGNS